jgi:hypothetical protein
VNRLLIDYDERATAATRKALAACQRARKMDGRLDPDFAARALTTFIMRLNHMDTLHPHLIGDKRWREFIAERVAVMLGLQSRRANVGIREARRIPSPDHRRSPFCLSPPSS